MLLKCTHILATKCTHENDFLNEPNQWNEVY